MTTFADGLRGDVAPIAGEYRFRRADGSWAWVVARTEVKRDDRGRALHVTCAMIDVSEIKAAQEWLGLLAAELPARAFTTDLELRVVHSVGNGKPAVTFPPGRTITELFENNPDRDRILEACRIALGGGCFSVETSDGDSIFQLNVRQLRAADHVLGVVGLALDVSERARAERELRKAQQQFLDAERLAHVGSSERDLRTGTETFSQETLRILVGDARKEVRTYDDLIALVHPDDRERVRAMARRDEQDGGTFQTEYRVVRPDGSIRWVRGTAQTIRDERGDPARVVGTHLDITERRRAELELTRRARQQSAVAQLSLSALRNRDVQPVIEEAVKLVAETLDVERSSVVEAKRSENRFVFRARVGLWNSAENSTVTVDDFSAEWFSSRVNEPLIIEDLETDPRVGPNHNLREEGFRSGIIVGIPGREHPFGVLGALSSRPRSFSEDEVSFVSSIAGVLGTAIEQWRVASELSDNRQQLHALSRKLIEAQEAERRAVAREIHDDFGQVLTALRLTLQRKGAGDAETISLVDGAIARMRELAQDLRPPLLDELGLGASLKWYVEREASRVGLDFEVVVDLQERLPSALETTCFRVAQEALTNVLRHAEARRVHVGVREASGLVELTIRDDGKGFDPGEARRRAAHGASQGMLGMQERVALAGGEFVITSTTDGTSVRAQFPVERGGR